MDNVIRHIGALFLLLAVAGGFFAAQAQAPATGEWLLGEWVGVRQERFTVDATIKIASYDPTTRKFKGNGELVNRERPVRTDVAVEGMIDDKGRVVMTMYHFGGLAAGKSFTFELERAGEDRLSGSARETRVPATLELKKKTPAYRDPHGTRVRMEFLLLG